MRYQLEFVYGDPNFYIIHLPVRLVDINGENVTPYEYEGGVKTPCRTQLPKYLRDLKGTDGVEEVRVTPHSIRLHIGEMFSLNEVWAGVRVLLEAHLCEDGEELEPKSDPFMMVPDGSGGKVRKTVGPKQRSSSSS